MTDEMEALAREAFSAYNERDASAERAREFSTPDAEVVAVTLGRTYSLAEGYGLVFDDLDHVWEENQVTFQTVERLGEGLLVRATVEGRAKTSDVEIEQPYWYLMDFATVPERDALRIARMRVFGELEPALAAGAGRLAGGSGDVADERRGDRQV